MEIIKLNINEVIPYPDNPRKNDNAVDAVAESIKQCGYCSPIVIDEDNVILAGHTRLKALKKLKWKEVECVRKTGLTEEQKKKYRILDNKTNELAEWDFDLLEEEIDGMDFDGFDFGFEMSEFEEPQTIIEDEPPEVDEENEPITQLGDIWQLGAHRLMCGDSTSETDIDKLIDGEKADMVVTDLPYNVAISNSQGMTIKNDNMDSNSFREFLYDCFKCLNKALKQGGAFYVWYASREHINFEGALNDAGLTVREQLIWNKNTFILGRQDYHWKHEPCLYGWKDGAPHYFVDDRTQSTVIEDAKPEIKKMKKSELIELLQKIYGDKVSTTVLNEDKPAVNDMHPTMKPVKLIARQIKNSSKQKENVLDLFGGSGSTLMACEQLNRKCYMMELDPKYCDVIVKRWETFTGKKAVKIN